MTREMLLSIVLHLMADPSVCPTGVLRIDRRAISQAKKRTLLHSLRGDELILRYTDETGKIVGATDDG